MNITPSCPVHKARVFTDCIQDYLVFVWTEILREQKDKKGKKKIKQIIACFVQADSRSYNNNNNAAKQM